MSPRASNDSVEGEAGPSLSVRLRARIVEAGPLTFRDWMSAALYDEREGYYRGAGRSAGGARATTARRRSAAHSSPRPSRATSRNSTKSWDGRASFTCSKRAAARVASRTASCEPCGVTRRTSTTRSAYVFDESSADSRERAAALLSPFAERVEFRRLSEIDGPLDAAVLFSNELLDALPVHRVTMRGGRLLESYVGTDVDGGFVFVEGEPSTPRLEEYVRRTCGTLEEGQVVEVNFEAGAWVARAAALLGRGFVVTVDYGDEAASLYGAPHRRGGTLRAFRGHELSEDVLRDPGRAGLDDDRQLDAGR